MFYIIVYRAHTDQVASRIGNDIYTLEDMFDVLRLYNEVRSSNEIARGGMYWAVPADYASMFQSYS